MRASLLSQPSCTDLSEEELAQVRGGIFRYDGGAATGTGGVLISPFPAGVFSSNASNVWQAASWRAVHAWR
jgi:hypothetical protein